MGRIVILSTGMLLLGMLIGLFAAGTWRRDDVLLKNQAIGTGEAFPGASRRIGLLEWYKEHGSPPPASEYLLENDRFVVVIEKTSEAVSGEAYLLVIDKKTDSNLAMHGEYSPGRGLMIDINRMLEEMR